MALVPGGVELNFLVTRWVFERSSTETQIFSKGRKGFVSMKSFQIFLVPPPLFSSRYLYFMLLYYVKEKE
jgi:hypothetical protein